jgi:hypothetical protein
MAGGELFCGECEDPLIDELLYSRIGAPAAKKIVVTPFKCLGRVLAVTYADFGARQPAAVQTDLIAALARYAGLVYENALYRKKFEKMLQTQH